jgi:hypothetical protein
MKEYKLSHLFFYPSMQILTGFALTRHFGTAWDTVIIMVTLCFLSIVTGLYMLLRSLEYVLRLQAWDAPTPKNEPVKVPIQNLNNFQMTTYKIKQDTDRMFCKALLEFPNLTESYWLNGNPSKWSSMGGAGRKDFVNCIDRLAKIGALERANPNAKNSPYRVANRRMLEHRASHPTPPL